jgi:hypothetical protein
MIQALDLQGSTGMAEDIAAVSLVHELVYEFGVWKGEPAHARVYSAYRVATPGVSP